MLDVVPTNVKLFVSVVNGPTTVMLTSLLPPWLSVTRIWVLPAATGVTVNITGPGPVPEPETVATVVSKLVALMGPL